MRLMHCAYITQEHIEYIFICFVLCQRSCNKLCYLSLARLALIPLQINTATAGAAVQHRYNRQQEQISYPIIQLVNVWCLCSHQILILAKQLWTKKSGQKSLSRKLWIIWVSNKGTRHKESNKLMQVNTSSIIYIHLINHCFEKSNGGQLYKKEVLCFVL